MSQVMEVDDAGDDQGLPRLGSEEGSGFLTFLLAF